MLGFGTKVDYDGPLFVPGRAQAVLHAAAVDTEHTLAEEGAQMVRSNLDHVLKHPTGYYRSHVRAHGDEVTDSGVIYGPWLEGTGSRNRTTRFKGYFTFRRTTQQIEGKAEGIAERTLAPYLRRLQ